MSNLLGIFSLFGKIERILTGAIIAIVVLFIICIFLKNKYMRKAMVYVVAIIIICVGIFAGITLYRDVTAKSYIRGEALISNQIIKEEFYYYNSTGVALYENEMTGKYEYTHDIAEIIDFDATQNSYSTSINNIELKNIEYEPGEIYSTFTLSFYTVQDYEIIEASMDIRIQFLSNKTHIVFSVTDENEANYMKKYFENNGLLIKVNKINQTKEE